MTNRTSKNNRRGLLKFWIYPRFQGLMLAINILLLTAIFSLILGLTYRSHEHLKLQGTLSNLQPGHPYFQFLSMQFQTFCSHLLLAFGLSAIFTSFAMLVISQRLAGPILRLTTFFERIERRGMNENDRITFRKGDFFPELPLLINRTFDRIQRDLKSK